MSDVPAYFAYLKSRQAAMVEEVKRYCAIESGSRDKEGIDRVGPLVAAAWQELGFTTETIAQPESGNHMIARRPGAGRGRLLCHMHLDTTQPRGTIIEHPIEERDGRVYGPGIIDMKGGWVVLLGAFRALRNAGWDGLERATVFLCGDEELGSPSGRPLIEAEARAADWQVIMEPSRTGPLVISRGVVGAIAFTIYGNADDRPGEQAASAIAEAAHKIQALEALSDPERGTRLRVGIVEAGTARQAVPVKAWLSIDLRARTQEDAEALVRGATAIAAQTVVPGTRTVITGGITRPLFKRNPGNVRMLELAQAAGRELGLEITEAPMSVGGSDGNFGAAMGLPSLDGLGPAGGAENNRQYILADSLPQKAALLAGVISRLPELLETR
ncbi:MAG TPA: M20/M25/M40 family metallo-hydrolase [Dehalococcoidia bacterium]|nr:M20/M25/M40 family metallo-hydrolase [Dehalococcoidia bacterium]